MSSDAMQAAKRLLAGGSLSQQLAKWLGVCLVCSLVFFFSLFGIINSGALPLEGYVNARYDAASQDLQNYVDEQGVSSNDANKLLSWARRRGDIGLGMIFTGSVNEDGILETEPFDIDMTEGLIDDEIGMRETYDFDHIYQIHFTDQQRFVYLYGRFGSDVLVLLDIAAAAASIVIFFVLFLIGIRRRILYIGTLESEIAAMEGGDLKSPVTVEGDDELGRLAGQLEEMRKTLDEQIAAEQRAQQANRDLVTAMSHDLRTPLTSLLLYTQILKDGKFCDRAELTDYLAKIHSSAVRMKSLSDELLRYFLVHEDEGQPERRDVAPFGLLLGDLLSEFTSTVEAAGFELSLVGDLSVETFEVDEGKLGRIIDNLLSNILKYASKDHPVSLACAQGEDSCSLRFENSVNYGASRDSAMGIGLRNVRALMEEIGGSCAAEHAGRTFAVTLSFPRKNC